MSLNVDDIQLFEDDFFDCNDCGELILLHEIKTKNNIYVCPVCGSSDLDHFEG